MNEKYYTHFTYVGDCTLIVYCFADGYYVYKNKYNYYQLCHIKLKLSTTRRSLNNNDSHVAIFTCLFS